MKVIKEGGHRLFEADPETAAYVSKMLIEQERSFRQAEEDSGSGSSDEDFMASLSIGLTE